eukprot:TRINITY_DN7670_c0_g1_i1.p2 TRINITY_DN7670_c0_g1~~TRINITY_DN7670_c0_g1_i1.p2  ORF type:complete len:122 (+),score=9.82 TRINITY_DN7670_c0_g1_i1:164-529(+)
MWKQAWNCELLDGTDLFRWRFEQRAVIEASRFTIGGVHGALFGREEDTSGAPMQGIERFKHACIEWMAYSTVSDVFIHRVCADWRIRNRHNFIQKASSDEITAHKVETGAQAQHEPRMWAE